MKKKFYILAGVFGVVLLFAVIHFFRMPNLTIVYDYKGNAYTQNVRSPFRQKIKLEGYSDITFVTPNEKGYFCYAKDENGNGCFLSVENGEVKVEITEEHTNSFINYTAVFNGCLFAEYCFKDADIGDYCGAYLLIDFLNEKTYSYEKTYTVISSGNALWWINDDHMICKFENENATEIAKASWIVGVQNNFLLFYEANTLYQIDVESNEITECAYKADFQSYSTIGFHNIAVFNGDYYVGCKLSLLDHSFPTAFITHTSLTNINTGKTVILYSSTGKIYENIKTIEE